MTSIATRTRPQPRTEVSKGTLFGTAAYLMWGLFPLYWPLLEPAAATEILAHRILWSLVVVVVLLAATRRLGFLRDMAGRGRSMRLLGLAAVIIAVNWTVYIYAVNSGHVVETSLGYFVNPLVTVLLGVLLLGERLRGAQWAALGVAGTAVVILTVDYRRPPVIALVLATTFATYGLLKKKAGVGAVESLSVETAVLAPLALAYVVVLALTGEASFGSAGAGHAALMVSSGVVTAVPLLFFGAAATRVPLTTLGLLQYLAPTLQFATGVVLYDEPMPATRLAGFGLVWVGLAIFTTDAIVHRRRRQLALAVDAIG